MLEQMFTLQPMDDPMLEQVYPEGLQPMDRTYAGKGEKCEEEGAAERNCYGLTAVSHPPSTLHYLVTEEVKGLGMRE